MADIIADCQFDFSGANVAVTGGGQGLGRAYAKAFAKAGATVFILERNYQNACNVVSEINKSGGQAMAYELDVGNVKDIATVFDNVIAQYSSMIYRTTSKLRRSWALRACCSPMACG